MKKSIKLNCFCLFLVRQGTEMYTAKVYFKPETWHGALFLDYNNLVLNTLSNRLSGGIPKVFYESFDAWLQCGLVRIRSKSTYLFNF